MEFADLLHRFGDRGELAERLAGAASGQIRAPKAVAEERVVGSTGDDGLKVGDGVVHAVAPEGGVPEEVSHDQRVRQRLGERPQGRNRLSVFPAATEYPTRTNRDTRRHG